MKNRKVKLILGIFLLGVSILTFSCKDDSYVYQSGKNKGTPHNPNQPIEVTGVIPSEGKIREKILIKGHNFGNVVSDVKVYFNDGFADREANVLNVDGENIYCLAPRQNSGDNNIKVVVSDENAALAPQTFHYEAQATVSWVAGAGTSKGYGKFYNDGTLSEANFYKPHAIVALGDGQMMTFGFYENPAPYVRFISENDNIVITVQSNVYIGKPAINSTKTRVYGTLLNAPHTVYEYRKETGWTPYNIGEIKVPRYPAGSGYDFIRSLAMMDEEHDPQQEWLYFCHKNQTFGRYNINSGETEILADNNLNIPVNAWGGYLVYDKFKDCFYVSLYQSYSIYKITKTGTDWSAGAQAELYVGSPSGSAVLDGELADARFKEPMGMCMDDDGNLYICDSNYADVIRKISVTDGYVSTIAGKVGIESPQTNGDPLESIFLDPMDISYDGEGNFYIVEFWESTIRKYSIE